MYLVYIEWMYCIYIGLEQQPLTEGAIEWQQTGELISVHQMPLPTRVCGLFRSQTGRQSHHRLQATLRHVSRLGFAQGFCSMCVNNWLLMRSECCCECFVVVFVGSVECWRCFEGVLSSDTILKDC